MDIETLDRIYRRNNEMIVRRAGMAGIKAVSLGSESLDALVTRIADSYGLDAADRERLYPFRAGSAEDVLPAAVAAPGLIGAGRTLLKSGVGAARQAAKGREVELLARAGKVATASAATAAKTAGRAVPWLVAALGIYGASTAGWFWMRARNYNQRCYELLRERIEAEPEEPAPTKKPSRGGPREG